MWWLVLFLSLLVIVTFWPRIQEGLEGQEPQTSAEVISQLELNKASIEELSTKMKELQQAEKRISEIDNKINGTTEMLKSINAQCSKTG